MLLRDMTEVHCSSYWLRVYLYANKFIYERNICFNLYSLPYINKYTNTHDEVHDMPRLLIKF